MPRRRRLFDPFAGFLVWALHLIIIYTVVAVACQLGVASRMLIVGLVVFTVAAAAFNVVHAWLRYRQQYAIAELQFRTEMTIGSDAIATLAITWQLFALLIQPLCR